jgi:uncharacterized membrane protein YfcA
MFRPEDRDMNSSIIAALIGIMSGVIGGMLGIGGGIIMIPALTILLGFSQQTAQGTTTAAMLLPIGFFAALAYHQNGYVNMQVALLIAAGYLIGGYFGGMIAVSIDPSLLKKIFAVFLILVGIKILIGK